MSDEKTEPETKIADLMNGKIPGWIYIFILLGGGTTLGAGGMGFLGSNGHNAVTMEDLTRLETKADKIDEKVDALDDKLVELRVAIARFHAADAAP